MRNLIFLLFTTIVLTTEAYAGWTPLAAGLDFGTFNASKPSRVGDSQIYILRIDPKLWEPVLIGTSWDSGSENQTARGWCEKYKLTAAINAGMFGGDHLTHVGYLGSKGHINNGNINKYKSVAAFGPKKVKGLPAFRIFDLDEPGITMEKILTDFSSVVQNLRLIKKPGENRWGQQDRMWSEAALGEDSSGRIIFIFSKSPFTMHDFNRELLSLGIGLIAAQHLEGGPEAQLYFRVENVAHEMFGSYETAFRENDENAVPWPIPNVIGIRPKP